MMHVFDHLGTAPFRFVGYEYSVFQAVPGDPNCPMQPSSSCDHCGMGISHVCWIEDSQGKRFKVGSTCVEKTGDHGLQGDAKRVVSQAKKDAKAKKDAERIAKAREFFNENRSTWDSEPHPFIEGKTLGEYFSWMLDNAGNSGKLKVSRAIEKAQKG